MRRERGTNDGVTAAVSYQSMLTDCCEELVELVIGRVKPKCSEEAFLGATICTTNLACVTVIVLLSVWFSDPKMPTEPCYLCTKVHDVTIHMSVIFTFTGLKASGFTVYV